MPFNISSATWEQVKAFFAQKPTEIKKKWQDKNNPADYSFLYDRNKNEFYALEKSSLLGKGGFSKVKKALSSKGEVVAIKIEVPKKNTPDLASEPEIKILEHLRLLKGAILREYNKKEQTITKIYKIRDYIPGENLKQVLKKQDFSQEIRLRIALGCAKAVDNLHQQKIIHGDIKANNFLMCPSSSDYSLSLIDFGASRVMDDAGVHRSQSIVFTKGYTAPEVLKEGRYSTASAIFELGKMFNLDLGLEKEIWEDMVHPDYQQRPLLISVLERLNLALINEQLSANFSPLISTMAEHIQTAIKKDINKQHHLVDHLQYLATFFTKINPIHPNIKEQISLIFKNKYEEGKAECFLLTLEELLQLGLLPPSQRALIAVQILNYLIANQVLPPGRCKFYYGTAANKQPISAVLYRNCQTTEIWLWDLLGSHVFNLSIYLTSGAGSFTPTPICFEKLKKMHAVMDYVEIVQPLFHQFQRYSTFFPSLQIKFTQAPVGPSSINQLCFILNKEEWKTKDRLILTFRKQSIIFYETTAEKYYIWVPLFFNPALFSLNLLTFMMDYLNISFPSSLSLPDIAGISTASASQFNVATPPLTPPDNQGSILAPMPIPLIAPSPLLFVCPQQIFPPPKAHANCLPAPEIKEEVTSFLLSEVKHIEKGKSQEREENKENIPLYKKNKATN